MKAKLYQYIENKIVPHLKTKDVVSTKPQLILAFGDKKAISQPGFYGHLRSNFPEAEIAICSTAGEIMDKEVTDASAVITALEFDHTRIQTISVEIKDYYNSFDAGVTLSKTIWKEDLCYVMVLSDGLLVNGSELIAGINSAVPANIPVTGGLAADGIEFHSTAIGLNDVPTSGSIVIIGFYSKKLQVGHGSMGGWEMFGMAKKVTKSHENVLYEIDNNNALALWKEYLGIYAEDLPWSALLFPLAIIMPDSSELLVRTILSIDEESQSLTFAGDIPQGSQVKFMKANFDKLIDAASQAAAFSIEHKAKQSPDYCLLISCVGRKMILKNRVDEEVEAVADIFDDTTVISGFYSNGELSPFNKESRCQLHNQTMTITTFYEDTI